MDLNATSSWGTQKKLTISLRDALTIVIAFGWATKNSGPSGPTNPYRWAFHSYDTVLRGNPDKIEAGILAANGLNAQMNSGAILGVLAKHVAEVLPDLNTGVPFWQMNRARLDINPRDGSNEGLLWTWYTEMTTISKVGDAVSSKVGHHAFPSQMPLFDSVICKFWSDDHMWSEFHSDLEINEEWCQELERLVEVYRQMYQQGDGVYINRLRALDICLWIKGRNRFRDAMDAGAALLASATDPANW